jgi:hypothetical protein
MAFKGLPGFMTLEGPPAKKAEGDEDAAVVERALEPSVGELQYLVKSKEVLQGILAQLATLEAKVRVFRDEALKAHTRVEKQALDIMSREVPGRDVSWDVQKAWMDEVLQLVSKPTEALTATVDLFTQPVAEAWL